MKEEIWDWITTIVRILFNPLDLKGIARLPSVIASLFMFLSSLLTLMTEFIVAGTCLLLIGFAIHAISLTIALVLLKHHLET